MAARPHVGDVYRICNVAQGTREEAHGASSWRPHGVVLSSPDGFMNVAARGTQMREYEQRHDFWSPAVPALGLDKDGFFSDRDRWLKSFTATALADVRSTKYLGPLPEPQLASFCAWVER